MADLSGLSTVRPPGGTSEYDKAYKKGAQYKADQRARMKARYWAIKRLGAKALEGKDLDHIKPLGGGGSNASTNWRVRSVHENRGDKGFTRSQEYQQRHD